MGKQVVPVITPEQAAKCDADATTRAESQIARLVPVAEEESPKKGKKKTAEDAG